MSKPVDLGALQNALHSAEVLVKSTTTTLEQARMKADAAHAVAERHAQRHNEALQKRDAAKRAVLEAARQVASS